MTVGRVWIVIASCAFGACTGSRGGDAAPDTFDTGLDAFDAPGDTLDSIDVVDLTPSDGAGDEAFDAVLAASPYVVALSPPDVQWIDACVAADSTQLLANVSDGTSPPQTLPFAFEFFGQSYTEVQPSADGYVVIGAEVRSAAIGTYPLPDPPAPHPALFLYGHDLYQRATGVCVATVGTAPHRQYVIETNDAAHALDGSTHLTFEAILDEGTNTVDFVYESLAGIGTAGETCVVGIQNQDGTVATMYEFMMPGALHDGLAIRFTPQH